MTDLHAAFAQQQSVDLDDVAGIDEVGRISGTAHARRDPTRSHAYRLVPLYDK
jgi:hypothetical protein